MPLPDFIIVGAQKCGTSALRGMLNQHPDIHMGQGIKIKSEVHFFDKEHKRGLKWYKSLFKKGKVNGEKTPGYIANPGALIRMQRAVPHAKIIMLVRDPVKRFLSAHQHNNRVRGQRKGLRGAWRTDYDALWRGCYAVQLDFLRSLYPSDQVRVIISEDMRTNPAKVVWEIQKWLGLDPVKVGNNPRPDRELKQPDVCKRLKQFYSSHNERLYKMLNRPMRMQEWLGYGSLWETTEVTVPMCEEIPQSTGEMEETRQTGAIVR